MTPLLAALDGLRNARPSQLAGRLERPVRRRLFPQPGRRQAHPLPAAEALWRSPAFEPTGVVPSGSRLATFHSHYGEDVLAAARAGDVERARFLAAHWLDGNPPRPGDAWHPYTVATRVGNWIAAGTLEPALLDARVSNSIGFHGARLRQNLERDIGGNHVIRDLRGLALVAACLDEPERLAEVRSLLARELREQILRDGGHFERSPAYHLLVLRDLLEIQAVGTWPELVEAIERMRGFAATAARPDGRPSLFNDGAVDLAPSLELPTASEGAVIFAESGYAFVREGDLWLAFDSAPPSPRYLPPHAHADALSFQLWFGGRPVVVDPGSFTYEPGAARRWFRSTAAHSTIGVDGRDQLVLWGAFRGSLFPDVRPPELAEARSLTGEVRWRNGVVHRRTITWGEGKVLVRDRLEGFGTHRLRSTVPLGPGAGGVEPLVGSATRRPAWLSERFGERTAIENVVVEVDVALPAELGWEISLAG